jgi:hypothetical protein
METPSYLPNTGSLYDDDDDDDDDDDEDDDDDLVSLSRVRAMTRLNTKRCKQLSGSCRLMSVFNSWIDHSTSSLNASILDPRATSCFERFVTKNIV